MPLAIQIVSGNLNTYGNTGTYEDVAGTWGYTHGNATLTRSATFKYSGGYSSRAEGVLDFNLSGIWPFASANYGSFDNTKSYLVRAKVYVDASTPICGPDSTLEWSIGTPVGTISISDATDNWVNVEARFTGLSGSQTPVLRIKEDPLGDSISIGGDYIYVDQVEIYEYVNALNCTIQYDFNYCYTTPTATNTGTIVIGYGSNAGLVTESGEPIKANLNADFTYSSGGTTATGGKITFSGLTPGEYTVYARDSENCLKTAKFTVKELFTYGAKYRLLFHDLYSTGADERWKLEIQERDYVGSVTDVTGYSDNPVVLKWDLSGEQNIFNSPLIGSYIDVTLTSEFEDQFIEFFTYDDRQYKAVLSLWDGAGYDEIHSGYLITQNWSEGYDDDENYPIRLIFTDGLADLKNVQFGNNNSNLAFLSLRLSLITVIRMCLENTDLDYNIREALNLQSSNLNTGSSESLLNQAYVDPLNYVDGDGVLISCYDVLSKLIKSLTSRLYCADGFWNVELITQKSQSSVNYIVFDVSDGQFVTNGTATPRVQLRKPTDTFSDRVFWKDKSQRYSMIENFGNIKLTQNINIEPDQNMIPYGQFANEDVASGQITGWNINTTASPNSEILLAKRDNSETDFAFTVRFDPTIGQETVLLVSNPVKYYHNGISNKFKFKFDYQTAPIFTNCYIVLDYAVTLTRTLNNLDYNLIRTRGYGVFSASAPTVKDPLTGQTYNAKTTVDGKWNRLFINDHLQWNTLEVDAFLPDDFETDAPPSWPHEYELTVSFRITSNRVYDHTSVASLKADYIDATFWGNPWRRLRRTTGGQDVIHVYRAEISDGPEDIPNLIEDNSASGAFWALQDTVQYPTSGTVDYESWLQQIMIDNVSFAYFPDSGFNEMNEPETKIEFTYNNNALKNSLEIEHDHSDLDTLDVNYALISRSWFSRISSGEHLSIGNWKRRGVTEDKSLLAIIMEMIVGQYNTPRRFYEGMLDTRYKHISFWNTFYELRSGRILMPIGMELNLARNEASVEMVEVLKGDEVVDEGNPSLPTIEPPVTVNLT